MTVTCFKNLSMLRRDTYDHPIFLGPMYIHESSKTSDYSVFFDHIRSSLDNPRCSPTVGSDDEKALRNAIAQVLSQGHHIYCRRHLHTYCTEYMSRKVGLTDQQKKPLLAAVFGDAGVTASNSRVVFDGRYLADPPVVMKTVQHNHVADEELTRSRKTKEELCTAAQQRPL